MPEPPLNYCEKCNVWYPPDVDHDCKRFEGLPHQPYRATLDEATRAHEAVKAQKATLVRIIKKPDDPICVRVSIGGDPGTGYYCVYRGTKESAIAAMEATLNAMRGMAETLGAGKEPDIEPDEGKQFA